MRIRTPNESGLGGMNFGGGGGAEVSRRLGFLTAAKPG